MAIPYYSDPTFLAKLQGQQAPGQFSGGPFASTRSAIAGRLAGNRATALQNQMATQGAQAGRQAAQFGNQMGWAKWEGNLGRAAQALQAREAINQQRRLAYEQAKAARKRNRMGILSSGLGALGAIGGGILGSMVAPGVGGAVGAQLGGRLGGSLNG